MNLLNHKPSLATYYSKAMQDEYGLYRAVPKSKYKRFEQVESELMRKGINVKHYAQTVAKLWKFWCEKKDLATLPINVFLGERSQSWYDEYAMFAIDVVSPSFRRAKVVNDEFLLASAIVRAVVAGNYVTERQALRELKLSHYWYEAAELNDRPRLAVAEAIAKLFGVECSTTNYVELAELIRDRHICLEQRI